MLLVSTIWLIWGGLTVLLFLSAAINLSLRSRTFLPVAQRLEMVGRMADLRWLTDVRDRLSMATATLRTGVSLGILLVCVEIWEGAAFADVWRDTAAFGMAFVTIMIFGVSIPSGISKYLAGPMIANAMPLLRVMHMFLSPLLLWVDVVDVIIRRLAGAPERTAEFAADHAEREILSVVSEGEMQGAVDEQERQMIKSVMELDDTEASEIMTPRTDFVALPSTASLEDVRRAIAEHGHSRIPVYEGSIDDIVGVLYVKDLLLLDDPKGFDLVSMLRHVPFVPHDKPVDELLQEFRERKVHMAFVLDEYGGTMGLVTIEDILEELVGEIEDEYETTEASPIERIDENTVEVDARMHIYDLNDALNINLPEDDDYDTLGGFVFSTLGRIPKVGERCDHENIQISVIDAEPRRVNRLRVVVPPSPSPAGANGDSA
jgi:CBS domain containing-hemolysin-like protein